MIIKIHHSHNDINNFTEHTKGFLKSKHMESKIKGAHNIIDDSISPHQSPVLSLVLLHLKKIGGSMGRSKNRCVIHGKTAEGNL